MQLPQDRSDLTSRAAAACLLVFVVVVAALPVAQRGHYDVVSQAISELALGRLGWLMNVAFVVLGLGTALLASALHAQVPGARWTVRLLLAAAPLDVVSAVFHASLGHGPMPTTAVVHVAAGISTWLLTIGAMFCAVRPLRAAPAWRSLAGPTRVWACTSLVSLVALGPNVVGQDHFGLGQRVTVATFTSWMLVFAVRLARAPRLSPEPAGRPVEAAHPTGR